jgi:hypothetical protein
MWKYIYHVSSSMSSKKLSLLQPPDRVKKSIPFSFGQKGWVAFSNLESRIIWERIRSTGSPGAKLVPAGRSAHSKLALARRYGTQAWSSS